MNFSLNTQVGGITLSNPQDTTDANGRASTTINSGTVATTVRVTASANRNDGTTTTAQSSGVAITTGIPDNDSFSLSAETLNIEAGDFDGATTQITIRAADRFNNPVPDGTAINFTTEGGAIPSNCLTANGACSVALVSQTPRPGSGRVTVRATAIGEETFSDTTPSNGRYDDGELFVDLPEAFRDDNENNQRDPTEPFVDFNTDNNYNFGSGNFTGLLCNDTSIDTNTGISVCDTANTLNVRDDVEIIFSSSTLSIVIDTSPFDATPFDTTDGASSSTIDLGTGDSGSRIVRVTADNANNGQLPPAGTTISATTTQGTIDGNATFTVPNTNRQDFDLGTNGNQPYFVDFTLLAGDEDGDGFFRVEVTTPNGTVSRDSQCVDQDLTAPCE